MKLFLAWLGMSVAVTAAGAPLRVASLNPIATDLARQVGGDAVEIVALMEPGQDPHVYAPSPSALRSIEDARLILVMGKGLETYLDRLRDTLRPDQAVFEIGRMIPSLALEADMELFACCPAHAHGVVDPHWWHSPRNMKRAARLLADAFAKALPSEEAAFRARSRDYGRRMDELDRWARRELARVPHARRRLTTAHAAFNYFCDEYRFRATPVLGLSTLEQPRPGQIRQVIDTLAAEGTPALFPEANANPGVLANLAREAGIRLGGVLYAGSPPVEDPTFEALFRHNVTTLVEALAGDGP